MFDKNIYALDDMKEEGDVIPVFSIGDDELKFDDDYKDIMPVLALKNTVLFPGVVIPITVGRDKSIKALQKADKGDKFLGVITQTSIDSEDPTPDGLHRVGTIARIMKILKMPDGSTTAILQGRKRFVAKAFIHNEKMLEAEVEVAGRPYSGKKPGIQCHDIFHKRLCQKDHRVISKYPDRSHHDAQQHQK
jgi:ATP-dependent Lon protease